MDIELCHSCHQEIDSSAVKNGKCPECGGKVNKPYQSLALAPISEIREAAAVAYESHLFGIQSIEQGMAMMLLAQAKGIHYMLALERYDIIDGRPSMKATTMHAEFLESGGRVEWIQLDDQAAIAKFTHPQGGEIIIPWTIEMAKQAGLLDKKGSVFLKYPRAMLRSRCISEGIRSVCPGLVIGVYTPEETSSFAPANEVFYPPAPFVPQTEESKKQFGTWKVIDGDYARDEKGNFIRDDDVVDLEETEVFELKPKAKETISD